MGVTEWDATIGCKFLSLGSLGQCGLTDTPLGSNFRTIVFPLRPCWRMSQAGQLSGTSEPSIKRPPSLHKRVRSNYPGDLQERRFQQGRDGGQQRETHKYRVTLRLGAAWNAVLVHNPAALFFCSAVSPLSSIRGRGEIMPAQSIPASQIDLKSRWIWAPVGWQKKDRPQLN